MSKRHTTVLQQVAGCLSRVAETEWQRSCEEVRRISPHVGSLGEWRSLCEGGWTNPLPRDLPDPSVHAARSGTPHKDLSVPSNQQMLANHTGTMPTTRSRAPTPESSPIEQPQTRHQTSLAPELAQLPEGRNNSATSLTSLGSFPAPPTHFPLPPVHPLPQEGVDKTKSTEFATGDKGVVTSPPFEGVSPSKDSEVPLQPSAPLLDGPSHGSPHTPIPFAGSSPVAQSDSKSRTPLRQEKSPQTTDGNVPVSPKREDPESQPPRQIEPTSSSGGISSVRSNPSEQPPPRGDNKDGTEFGVRKANEPARKDRPAEAVERSDTGRSNGSMVAALRDRYSRAVCCRSWGFSSSN